MAQTSHMPAQIQGQGKLSTSQWEKWQRISSHCYPKTGCSVLCGVGTVGSCLTQELRVRSRRPVYLPAVVSPVCARWCGNAPAPWLAFQMVFLKECCVNVPLHTCLGYHPKSLLINLNNGKAVISKVLLNIDSRALIFFLLNISNESKF